MTAGVIDAGIAIAWLRPDKSRKGLDDLLEACRSGKGRLTLSTVNLAEILIHTTEVSRRAGVDAVTFLTAWGVRLHAPDEVIARRAAKLHSSHGTSLAGGFAAATAQELGARLHTTDAELVRRLRGARLAVTHYGA